MIDQLITQECIIYLQGAKARLIKLLVRVAVAGFKRNSIEISKKKYKIFCNSLLFAISLSLWVVDMHLFSFHL